MVAAVREADRVPVEAVQDGGGVPAGAQPDVCGAGNPAAQRDAHTTARLQHSQPRWLPLSLSLTLYNEFSKKLKVKFCLVNVLYDIIHFNITK